jgi:transcription initiation factor TFIID subunit 1, fungi type
MAMNGAYTSASGAPDDLFEDDDMANMADTPQETSFVEDRNDTSTLLPEGQAIPDEIADMLREAGVNENALNTIDYENIRDTVDKADDAEDYADISDDDLADDEDVGGGPVQPPQRGHVSTEDGLLQGLEEAAGMDVDGDIDDLFGGAPSSPTALPAHPRSSVIRHHEGDSDADGLASEDEDMIAADLDEPQFDDETHGVDPAWLEQQRLLSGANKDPVDPQKSLENALKACERLFPDFSRDEIPFWTRIIKPRTAEFTGKAPVKPPKPIRPNPTKVHLEIQQDQKTLFNSVVAHEKHYWEDHDRAVIIEDENADRDDEESLEEDIDVDEVLPGGVTMKDLDMICADFDTLSGFADSDVEVQDVVIRQEEDDDFFAQDEDWMSERPTKRRKLGLDPKDIVSSLEYNLPSFDDPERLTEKLAKKVVLDLNDPLLLTEEVDPATIRAKAQLADPTKGMQNVKELLRERFNYSNDAEYELLKQNHQHKIRSTLGHLSIEHSVPALRLQWPYYQVKLSTGQARTFHRPTFNFRPMMTIHFSKSNRIKRKHQKGKKAKDLYPTTKELSFGDNSTALLLEYSEEHPMILSQVGMGTRIINYYRRQTREDASRPKLDVGETAVLLPEDKSPFSIFGHIDPGETVSAVYNSMYRAPIFEHQPKHEDFLVVRSHTGLDGSRFFMRNVDHIYAVGQEFPSVSVPGPHSRVVTTASKNRLKMISFRIIRRKKNQRLSVGDVTKHFPDTTDMQNRQKMKEFMTYSKEHKEWEMKPGETVPDEEQLQQLVRAEDVCLLESMQVGQQYLYDAGFGGEDVDDDDDDKEGQGQALEQELAPWKTSKNFLNASQGKAMLTLHGEGDPSGRGEAFSFLKTSMKGGFKAIGESAMSKMEEKKELGGHSYNVARQQRSYEESIRRIWDAQKTTLSSNAEHSDIEMDDNVDGPDEDGQSNVFGRPGVRSEAHTPLPFTTRDDQSMISYRSGASQGRNRIMRITRQVPRTDGGLDEIVHIEKDPIVIKQYLKKRNARTAATRAYATPNSVEECEALSDCRLNDVLPTGDAEQDALDKKRYLKLLETTTLEICPANTAFVELQWSSLAWSVIVNAVSHVRKPRASPPHLLLTPAQLARLAPRPDPPLSQAASNSKGHSENVRIAAKWATSRRIKSALLSLLLRPLLHLFRGRGRLPPLLHPGESGGGRIRRPSLLTKRGGIFDSPGARLESLSFHWTRPFSLLLCSHSCFINRILVVVLIHENRMLIELFPSHRLCPLLNGTIKQEDGFNNAAFMGAPPTMP